LRLEQADHVHDAGVGTCCWHVHLSYVLTRGSLMVDGPGLSDRG